MPFIIVVLNLCTILLMYMLNNTGDRPHPCLTPLFIKIGSDRFICVSSGTIQGAIQYALPRESVLLCIYS